MNQRQNQATAENPQNFHEHDEHRKFFHDHFVVKGAEAATACAATVDKVRHLLSPS
jgi:6,7-dimethyl-8-ribityllumazine synthase